MGISLVIVPGDQTAATDRPAGWITTLAITCMTDGTALDSGRPVDL